MALSVSEFATKFKTKYPQYNEMPDDSLALLIIKKAPQYKKAVDLGTLQAKYFKTAKDFGILSDDDISGFSAPSKVAPVQPVKPSLSTVSGGEFSFLPGVMALANDQPSIPGITAFPGKPTIPAIQATPNASSIVSESASGMNSVAPGTIGNVVDQRVQANKLSRGPAPELSSDEIFRQGNQFQLRLAAAQKKWDEDYKLGKIPMKTIDVPGDMGRPASMSVPSIPRPTENSFTFEEAGVPIKPGSFQSLAGEVGTYFENVLGPATGLLLNRKSGERRAITFNEKKIAAEGIKAERELAQKEASGIALTPEERQLKETLNPGVWGSMVEMAKQVWDDPKRFIELSAPSMAVGVLTAPAMDAGIGFVASRVRDAARVYKLSRVSKILKARRAERLGEAMDGGPVVETKTAIDDVVSRYANQVGLQNARRAVADALIAGNDSRTLANALQKVGIQSTKGQRRLIANIGSEMAEEVGPVAFAQTVTDWGQGRGDLDAESIVTNVFSSLPIAAVGGGVMGGASSVFRNNAGMEAPVADRVAGRFMLDRGTSRKPDYAQGVSETVSSPEFQSTADRLARTENSPEVSRHFERLVPEIGAGINDSRIAGAGEDAFVRGRMQNRGAFTIGETAYGGGEAAGVHEAIHGVERFIKANPDTHGDVEVAIQDWKDQAYSDLRENNPELFKSLQSMTRTEREAKEELFAQTMTRALGHEDNDWGLTMEPALLQRFSQYIGQSIPEPKSAASGSVHVANAEDLADVPFSVMKNNQRKYDEKFMRNDMSGLSDRVTRVVSDASDDYRLPNIHKIIPASYVPKQSSDKTVTIYRGVPKDVSGGIRVGDWVSLDEDYAKQHGTGGKEGTNKVVSITVPTSDVVWAGTDMNEFFYAPEGIRKDGESPVDVLNRLGEDYFSKSKKEEKPRLRVTHNLDESNLEKVDKLGGFAKPSLAVMRSDQPASSDFGDITLVGKKELGNPKNEPVFDRDVYSPRIPSKTYKKSKKLDEFISSMYKSGMEGSKYSGHGYVIEKLNNGDKDGALRFIVDDEQAMSHYLKENGKLPDPVVKSDITEDIFKNNETLQNAAIKLYENDEMLKLKKLLYTALSSYYEKKSKTGSASLRKNMRELSNAFSRKAKTNDINDVIAGSYPNRMVQELISQRNGEIDSYATRDLHKKIIRNEKEKYIEWWSNKLDKLMPESSAFIEGTRKKFNLENIVDSMKGIKAKEKGMTYSTGHAKAAAAEQFSDIEQMRNAAIERMMPKDEDGEKDNLLFDYVSRLANYTKYSSHFSAMDYASEAIGKLAAGAITESRARAILSADHDVSTASINTIMEAAESIKKVMTDMFEAKPQRAVGFDEFSGAVVPENVSQKTLDILNKRGISKIEKYRPGDIESRTEALNKFTEDQFSVVKAGIPESKKNDPKVVAEAKRQWEEKGVDSPFFKRWFGDSKVVDADGKPLVVYHGAPDVRFVDKDGTFKTVSERYGASEPDKRAFWFASSNKTALSYADDRRAFDYQNAVPGVIKAYIKLENPLVVDGLGKEWREAQSRGKTSDVISQAREGGYDGAIIRNVKDDYNNNSRTSPTDTYVVFSPTQIKSATANRGTFDEENADIRFSLYPRNDKQKAQRSIIKAAYDGLRKNGLALPNKISLHDISQKWGAIPSGLDDEARNAYRKKWDSALESLREFIIEDEALALDAGISKSDIDNENIQEIVWKLSDWANSMSEKPKKSMEGFTAEDERMLRGASPEVIAEYELAKSDAIAGKSKKKISKDEHRRVARYTPPEGMAVDEWNTANDIGIPHGDPTASYKDVFGGQVASGETPETKTDIIVRQVYDYLDPLKKIQVRLTGKESGGAMHEAMLQASRAQDKANKVKHSFLDPVKKIMQKSGLTLEDVDRFLYARHAIERNEKVALINEDFRDPENQGGSGMSNKTARAIMRRYEIDEPEKFKALQRIGIINDRMNKWRIDYARSAGILTAEEEAAYEKSYKHYVPLRGRADDVTGEIKSSSGMKKGMQAHKSEKRALGRRSMAESVTAQNFTRTLEIVSNAEKNKVGLAVAKMVRDNQDPEFWTIDKTPMKYVYDKKTGEAKRAPDMKMNAPNEFTFYENGERHTIRFNTKEGLRIATALNGMSDVTGNTVLKAVSQMNRMLAGMITSYSPEFVLSNASRDAITASITSSVRDGAKVAAKTIASAPKAAVAITGREFGKNMGEWGKYYQRFTKAGGKTAFLTLESFDDFAKNIESDLMDGQRSNANPKKVFKNLIHAIERVNAGVENGTRLAYFRNLVESGMSDEDAALKAKELTVNFERHGQQKWMNQLWMFMNTALQGAANVARLFTNEKTRKAALSAASTLVAVGASNALMNKELGGSDDESGEDYWDRIQPWEKDRNIVFLNPLKKDGSGVRIPLPYEFSFFIRLGQELVDMGYGKHPLDVAMSTVNSAISAVSPLGSPLDMEDGGVKNPIGLAIPTPLQPFADIERNRDYSGRAIYPEDIPFGPKRPDSQKYYPGVNPIIRDATTWANRVTGGNEHESGKIDINPENIEHIINAYTGGIGQLLQRGSGAIKSATSPDEEVQVRQIPFVRKFFRGDMGNDRADFKKIADKAGQVDAHYISLLKDGKNSEADQYENENYLLISTARIFKDAGKGIDFTSKQQRDELTDLYKRSKRQFKRAEDIDLKLKESTDSEKQKVYRKQIDSLLSSAWDGFMDGVK